jgi:hypothetical protein
MPGCRLEKKFQMGEQRIIFEKIFPNNKGLPLIYKNDAKSID